MRIKEGRSGSLTLQYKHPYEEALRVWKMQSSEVGCQRTCCKEARKPSASWAVAGGTSSSEVEAAAVDRAQRSRAHQNTGLDITATMNDNNEEWYTLIYSDVERSLCLFIITPEETPCTLRVPTPLQLALRGLVFLPQPLFQWFSKPHMEIVIFVRISSIWHKPSFLQYLGQVRWLKNFKIFTYTIGGLFI